MNKTDQLLLELERTYKILDGILSKRISLCTEFGDVIDEFAVKIDGCTMRDFLLNIEEFKKRHSSLIAHNAITQTHHRQVDGLEKAINVFAQYNFLKNEPQ